MENTFSRPVALSSRFYILFLLYLLNDYTRLSFPWQPDWKHTTCLVTILNIAARVAIAYRT